MIPPKPFFKCFLIFLKKGFGRNIIGTTLYNQPACVIMECCGFEFAVACIALIGLKSLCSICGTLESLHIFFT